MFLKLNCISVLYIFYLYGYFSLYNFTFWHLLHSVSVYLKIFLRFFFFVLNPIWGCEYERTCCWWCCRSTVLKKADRSRRLGTGITQTSCRSPNISSAQGRLVWFDTVLPPEIVLPTCTATCMPFISRNLLVPFLLPARSVLPSYFITCFKRLFSIHHPGAEKRRKIENSKMCVL